MHTDNVIAAQSRKCTATMGRSYQSARGTAVGRFFSQPRHFEQGVGLVIVWIWIRGTSLRSCFVNQTGDG